MRDFSKWASLWDAYSPARNVVSGSPADVCGFLGSAIAVGGFIALMAILLFCVATGKEINPDSIFCCVVVPVSLGMVVAAASSFLPSYTSTPEPPELSERIVTTWKLDDLTDCANRDGKSLPEKYLEDGDWSCSVYKNDRRSKVTVHINGDKVGLYDSKGKAVK